MPALIVCMFELSKRLVSFATRMNYLILGRCAIVGRIPYWGCKSNLCGADLEGGGASNLTGADRGRMWIGAVSPASIPSYLNGRKQTLFLYSKKVQETSR